MRFCGCVAVVVVVVVVADVEGDVLSLADGWKGVVVEAAAMCDDDSIVGLRVRCDRRKSDCWFRGQYRLQEAGHRGINVDVPGERPCWAESFCSQKIQAVH